MNKHSFFIPSFAVNLSQSLHNFNYDVNYIDKPVRKLRFSTALSCSQNVLDVILFSTIFYGSEKKESEVEAELAELKCTCELSLNLTS